MPADDCDWPPPDSSNPVPESGFYHGNAALAGRALLFFYFEQVDTGVAALIPGPRGAMEVARFRLTAGLPDPRKN